MNQKEEEVFELPEWMKRINMLQVGLDKNKVEIESILL